ncbi:hypothetical protein GQ54DRAFT_252178, partial [Martensiomyces pterosporus]
KWLVGIRGTDSTLIVGKELMLQFGFPDNYPAEALEMIFLGQPPEHLYIYGNGHVCLSILCNDWSLAITADAVCLSVLLMM